MIGNTRRPPYFGPWPEPPEPPPRYAPAPVVTVEDGVWTVTLAGNHVTVQRGKQAATLELPAGYTLCREVGAE